MLREGNLRYMLREDGTIWQVVVMYVSANLCMVTM